MSNFEKDLAILINTYSKENESNTPDFILVDYLKMCLVAFAKSIKERDVWYGVTPLPGKAINYVDELSANGAVTGLPVAHVVGEEIAGVYSFNTYHCQGKCNYSSGLIRLDKIKLHSKDGILLGMSDSEGNIVDTTEDQSGVTGRIGPDGRYNINLIKCKGLPFITYDYEYSLSEEV